MDLQHLRASDGTGEAVLAHIQTPRTVGSTVLDVDNVDNWPQTFTFVTGTPAANGFISPTGMKVMYGHLNAGDIIIDGYAPGYSDNGNTSSEVAIVKMTTSWADLVANTLLNLTGMIVPFAGSAAPTSWLLCQGQAVSRTTYDRLFAVIGTTYGAGNGTTTFNLPDLRSRTPIGAGQSTYVDTQLAANYNTSDTITVNDNDTLHTGQAVVLTTSGTAPGGLTAGTTYYVIRLTSTTIKLATTRANAVAGTAIDITSTGTGSHTLTMTLTNRSLGRVGGEETHSLTTAELAGHTHPNRWAVAMPNGTGSLSINDQTGDHTMITDNGGANVVAISGDPSVANTAGSSDAHNNISPYVALNYIIKT